MIKKTKKITVQVQMGDITVSTEISEDIHKILEDYSLMENRTIGQVLEMVIEKYGTLTLTELKILSFINSKLITPQNEPKGRQK